MNSKTKVAFVAMAILTLTSVAFCAVILYKDINTTMRVKMSAALGVFDTDKVTPLTSIGLGDFLWADNFYYPSKTRDNMPTQPADSYWLNNTDQTTIFAQLIAPNISGITFSIWIKRLDDGTWQHLNSGDVYQLALTSPSLDPDHPLLHSAQFYLQVVVTNAAFGDYAPTLRINACDSPTG